MKFNNIQHIFFDLDHTLWDFDKNSALTFEIIFKEQKIDLNINDFLAAYTPINENYWKLYRDNKISKEDLRTGRLKDCFNSLKYEVSPFVIETLSVQYIKFLPGFNNLLENTHEMLDYLYPKYNLHIITNGFEEVQHNKLQNSKISPFFRTVTTSEEAGVKKPHSGIFKLALEKSGGNPRNSLMIGDSYEADILGAQKMGMQSVYFDYYQREDNLSGLRIKKLNELKHYL